MNDKIKPQPSLQWKEWIERAEEDYLLAQSAIRRKSPLAYGATFHSQQCVEKIIKAILIYRSISFPRTHDLAALGLLCKKSGIILPIDEDALEVLTGYGVEARYPGTQLTIDEAKESVKLASTMRKFSKKIFR